MSVTTGENIKRLRKSLELSGQKFGDLLGIPKGRIEGWERGDGNPKADDEKKLTEYFGISSEVLKGKLLTKSEADLIVSKARYEKKNTVPIVLDVPSEGGQPELFLLREKVVLLERIIQAHEQTIRILTHEKVGRKNGV